MLEKIIGNRKKTLAATSIIIDFLSKNQKGFKDLPLGVQFDLAMKFFQCERGRLQKGKLFVDMVAHLIPLVIALVALIISLHR